MIRNIIFDMGNVLIRFDQQYFIQRLGVASEDAPLLMRELLRSVEWARMDRGSMTEAEPRKASAPDSPSASTERRKS